MKWGLQHVKVTLEDVESGEVVVIEQRPDGTLVCKEKGEGRPREVERKIEPKKAEEAKKAEPKQAEAKKAAPKPAAKEPEPKAAKEERKSEPKNAEGKEARPRRPRSAKPRGERKTLEWKAIKDDIYDGYAAKSRSGLFKALHARNTQWALFYERDKSAPYHVGCFSRLEQAQARAQELHRLGWPEAEFGKVTPEHVERACPVPEREREAEPASKAAPAVAEEAAPQSESAADKELLGSFGGVLGQVLDEED